MRDWLGFLKSKRKMLSFGFFMNFFSGYGQTFLVSLYVPFMVDFFGITNSFFGSLYSAATLLSALLLTWAGKYIDRIKLKTYSYATVLMLVLSTVLLSQAGTVLVLFVAITGLRLSGQGLMSHISATTTVRYFASNRGRALGVTSLGHPAGQFLLPLFIVPFISLTGWRESILLSAALAFVMLPLVIHQSGRDDAPNENGNRENDRDTPIRQIDLLRERKFWLIAANSFVIPFLCTALFLYQVPVGESKGWSIEWVAFSFTFYALFNAVSMLAAGWLIDRYTARFLFPLYLIPMFLGVLTMSAFTHRLIGPLYMALVGVSSGLGSPVKTALQAEIYGTEYLGSVRSLFSSLLILSTALGPPLFGLLLDIHVSYPVIFLLSASVLLGSMLISFRLVPDGQFQNM